MKIYCSFAIYFIRNTLSVPRLYQERLHDSLQRANRPGKRRKEELHCPRQGSRQQLRQSLLRRTPTNNAGMQTSAVNGHLRHEHARWYLGISDGREATPKITEGRRCLLSVLSTQNAASHQPLHLHGKEDHASPQKRRWRHRVHSARRRRPARVVALGHDRQGPVRHSGAASVAAHGCRTARRRTASALARDGSSSRQASGSWLARQRNKFIFKGGGRRAGTLCPSSLRRRRRMAGKRPRPPFGSDWGRLVDGDGSRPVASPLSNLGAVRAYGPAIRPNGLRLISVQREKKGEKRNEKNRRCGQCPLEHRDRKSVV